MTFTIHTALRTALLLATLDGLRAGDLIIAEKGIEREKGSGCVSKKRPAAVAIS